MRREVGFLELLRQNSTYRRLWIGLAISMLGEWFNTVALFVLIYTLTGSELGIGLLFVIRMFSLALPQVFTGMLADRYSRKWLMIWANILSAIAVLTLLMVDEKGEVWMIYFISSVLMMLHAVFIPAERATIPNITEENELLTANALSSATWSAALCLGASLGGFVVSAYGVEAAFIINAVCFVLGALMYSTLTIPQEPFVPKPGGIWANTGGNIADGFRIIFSKPHVSRIITAKALWAVFGGGYQQSPIAGTNRGEITTVIIASEGNETKFGDLSKPRYSSIGLSSKTRAVFLGGSTDGATVDSVFYESGGTAVNFGELDRKRWSTAGSTDSHGGLGGY